MKRLLTSLAAGAVLLAGCSHNGGSSSADDQLKVELPLKTTTLAPYDTDVPVTIGAAETLFKTTSKGDIKPHLVKSYEQPSDDTLTFTLKDGIKFQNGHALTGQAVKDSLEQGLKNSELLKATLPIESIKAEGQKVTIKTKGAYPELISELASPFTAIYDTKSKTDIKQSPVGTGPYAIKDFKRTQQINLNQNKDYWHGKPELKSMKVTFNEDGSSRTEHVLSGRTDVTTNVPVDKINSVKKSDKAKLENTSGFRTSLLLYNHTSPKMTKEVREALDAVINRQQISDKVADHYAKPANGPFNTKLDFIKDKAIPKQDISKAKALMEKAGYSEKHPLKLNVSSYSGRPELTKTLQVIQSDAKKAHIQIKIQNVDDIEGFLKNKKDWDASMYSFGTIPRGDTGYFFNMAYKKDGAVNKGAYHNHKVDQLIEQLNHTVDKNERHHLTNEILEVSKQDVPNSYILYNDQINAMNKKVENVQTTPEGIYLIDEKVDKQK